MLQEDIKDLIESISSVNIKDANAENAAPKTPLKQKAQSISCSYSASPKKRYNRERDLPSSPLKVPKSVCSDELKNRKKKILELEREIKFEKFWQHVSISGLAVSGEKIDRKTIDSDDETHCTISHKHHTSKSNTRSVKRASIQLQHEMEDIEDHMLQLNVSDL